MAATTPVLSCGHSSGQIWLAMFRPPGAITCSPLPHDADVCELQTIWPSWPQPVFFVTSARAGHRRFGLLSPLRSHPKAPSKTD